MLLIVLCVQAVAQVLSQASLPPPQNVHVDDWLLTWTPVAEGRDVTYTVKYRSFDSAAWERVPACVGTSRSSCNVSSTKGEHGCVALQVRARGRLQTSEAVEACSTHVGPCTPEVNLTAQPGTLTVHLSGDHSLADEYADHIVHRVYYGTEGEPLQVFGDSTSSVSIPDLQEGRRYCAKVQYVYFNTPVGLPSCTRCELIPETRKDLKQTEIIVAAVVVIALLVLIPVTAYVLIFQHGRIKQWLRPPYEIPEDFFLEPLPGCHRLVSTSSPNEEHCDVISSITPE
ncbi:interferon gamma receptor 2 [Enoplosus armatus]|uniref:interferon gamma receptor 2 n=1 Tax=Enoplosus armatus TaxID=215367 RepID=UPI0039968F0A